MSGTELTPIILNCVKLMACSDTSGSSTCFIGVSVPASTGSNNVHVTATQENKKKARNMLTISILGEYEL